MTKLYVSREGDMTIVRYGGVRPDGFSWDGLQLLDPSENLFGKRAGDVPDGVYEMGLSDFNPYHEPAGSEKGGEFAKAPGGHDLSQAMQRSLEENGGFTFNSHGVTPKTGYAVGGYDGKPQWDVGAFTVEDARGFLAQNGSLLRSGGGYHVGGWVDSGKVYLDVVKVFGSRRGAVKAGKSNNQIAITDLARIHAKDFDNAFIPTGGTGDAMPEGSKVKGGTYHLFPEDVTAEDLFAAISGGKQLEDHVLASRERMLKAANWLREAATGDWLKDIEPEEPKPEEPKPEQPPINLTINVDAGKGRKKKGTIRRQKDGTATFEIEEESE